MLKSKNLLLYEAVAILLVFTIGYFIIANKVSYAFAYDSTTYLYDSKIKLITKSANLYGESNLSLFKEKDTIYVTVGDLVEKGILLADDEAGNVKDPTSEVKNLNELKVRIVLKDGKINSKVLS